MGFISKGIALCGKMEFIEAMGAFDLAFMFIDQDKSTLHLLLLVKACRPFIILFLLHPIFRRSHFSMEINTRRLCATSET